MNTPNLELDALVRLASEGTLSPQEAAVALGRMALEWIGRKSVERARIPA